MTPDADFEMKARRLRALFREHKPAAAWNRLGKYVIDQAQQAEQWRLVSAEYERLFGEPTRHRALERILTSVWREERELAGQRYDYVRQAWCHADGSIVKGVAE